MGNNSNIQFGSGNLYIGLILASPVGSKPWRFWYCYLANNSEISLGTEKSLHNLTWRAIPYTNDPWGDAGGAQPNTVAATGSTGAVLWDHASATW